MVMEILQKVYFLIFKEYNEKIIYRMEIPKVTGGWSYSQSEMNELFKHINYKVDFKVLEIGLGASTLILFNHFKKYCPSLQYDGYESNSYYAQGLNCLNKVYIYNENNIDTVDFGKTKYDLILVDGPTGECRSKWYKLLKNNINNGTIMLIDDYSHYSSFNEQLNAHYKYELLSINDIPFTPGGDHSWKIVKIIETIPDN